VPPARRRAYEYLDAGKTAAASTTTVAEALALPTNTTRRVLEELAAYGLIERTSQGAGKADLWAKIAWDEQEAHAL
jgi:DNA-binding IclR family transcriptional regulator